MNFFYRFLFFFFSTMGCVAQIVDSNIVTTEEIDNQVLLQSINTAGGLVTGENGSGSYAIGQLFLSDMSSPAHKITEGVLQQIDQSLNELITTIAVEAYPNPTTDYFFIEVDDYKSRNLSYQLVNLQGKILTRNLIQDFKTKITSTFLHQGIYIISVLEDNEFLKSFKIIKR
ncbi:T9SS type A sorting domain-containing protein [Aurantibacter sp.]|uniref:T9SS type A sorting domain-containing protein n=1 Tax=Aurantibacter sp. TaxID=2807103 RepID=UPI003264B544